MYSTAHVKGKHYTCVSPWETRGGPVSYTRVNSILHAGALRDTRTRDRVRGRAHARVVNQHLGVVNVRLLETELRFDRKLQEANVDQSEGDSKLRASRPRWQKLSERPQIQ